MTLYFDCCSKWCYIALNESFCCCSSGFSWFYRTIDFGGFLICYGGGFQVPVGGCYRLIDIPMSNCLNSGINKIFVLTQFNSAPLNRHLARTYHGNGINFGDGFVEVWYILTNYCFYATEESLLVCLSNGSSWLIVPYERTCVNGLLC